MIVTERLELVPATPESTRSALAGSSALATSLRASVPATWPPSDGGAVEVGYGIVSDRRRRGYASEATRGLLANAFAIPRVRRVIAETLPELAPSIGVLEKCGFRPIGEGSEPGVIRFELTRAAWR